MKTTKLLQSIILVSFLFFSNNLISQQYNPFPVEDAFWTVIEFPSTMGSQHFIYTVKGDTVLNNNQYKKIYKLSKVTGSSDTLWTLHSFMRQNVANKKVYFIRHYQGETTEKLGYDFDVSIGDTVYLPAFDYQNIGDSIFKVIDPLFDSTQLNDGTYRKNYFFNSLHPGIDLDPYVTEGVGTQRTPFPNLFFYDGNHQTFLLCTQVNGELIMGDTSALNICGLTIVNTNEYQQNFKITTSPNPCNNLLLIKIFGDFENDIDLQLVNLIGTIIYRDKIINNEMEYKINTSNFPGGIYVLRLRSNPDFHYEEKIIIIH